MAEGSEAKQTKGQPLRVRATTWNAMVDAMKASRSQRLRSGVAGVPAHTIEPANTILVKNLAADFDVLWQVLELGDPILTPEGQGQNIAERIGFEGDAPASDGGTGQFGPIAILQTPADLNDIVTAVVSGVTCCYVLMNDPDHEWANPVPGVSGYLESVADGGVARILWHGEGGDPPAEPLEVEFALVDLIGTPPTPLPAACEARSAGTPLAGDVAWRRLDGANGITLPGPGTFLVSWEAHATGNLAAGGAPAAGSVDVRLTDCNGANYAYVRVLSTFRVPDLDTGVYSGVALSGSASGERIVTVVGGGLDVFLEVQSAGPGVADVAGRVGYLRVAPTPAGGCAAAADCEHTSGSGSGDPPSPSACCDTQPSGAICGTFSNVVGLTLPEESVTFDLLVPGAWTMDLNGVACAEAPNTDNFTLACFGGEYVVTGNNTVAVTSYTIVSVTCDPDWEVVADVTVSSFGTCGGGSFRVTFTAGACP